MNKEYLNANQYFNKIDRNAESIHLLLITYLENCRDDEFWRC